MNRAERRQNLPSADDLTTVSDRLWHAFPLPESGAFTDLLVALDRRARESDLEEASDTAFWNPW